MKKEKKLELLYAVDELLQDVIDGLRRQRRHVSVRLSVTYQAGLLRVFLAAYVALVDLFIQVKQQMLAETAVLAEASAADGTGVRSNAHVAPHVRPELEQIGARLTAHVAYELLLLLVPRHMLVQILLRCQFPFAYVALVLLLVMDVVQVTVQSSLVLAGDVADVTLHAGRPMLELRVMGQVALQFELPAALRTGVVVACRVLANEMRAESVLERADQAANLTRERSPDRRVALTFSFRLLGPRRLGFLRFQSLVVLEQMRDQRRSFLGREDADRARERVFRSFRRGRNCRDRLIRDVTALVFLQRVLLRVSLVADVTDVRLFEISHVRGSRLSVFMDGQYVSFQRGHFREFPLTDITGRNVVSNGGQRFNACILRFGILVS